ncbi:MAG: dihydrolipoamide acyltransferase [Nitrosospira sp. 56-18]|jgi:hypothetical protein|nr:MAG: dihydrolipoamide acyltransferase [Nitrosospira sp. 56-18]
MGMMFRKPGFISAVIVWMLGGCAIVPHTPSIEPSSQREIVLTGQMDDMMEFYESLRKLSAAELSRVYDKVKQNFVQNKSDSNRIRLVLVLIMPHTSFRDVNSALYLLNEWPRGEAKTFNHLSSFRNLLAAQLGEQQRLGNSVDELSQKLKDEQKRVETMQNQIDAIKSMEKNLLREQP